MFPEDALRRKKMTSDALARVAPGQFGSEDAVRGLMRRDLEGSPDVRPRIAVSSQPAAGIIGSLPKLDLGLSKPKPTSDAPVAPMVPQPREMSLEAPPPPPPSQPPAPYLIGPSVKGLGDTERGLVLRDALRSADPTSKVRIQGDQVDIAPPEKPGRWSTGFSAALEALASADPDNPMQALGRGIGGLLTGAVSPRSGAKINRRFELDRLENDIQRGLKLDANQAQVEQMQLPKLGQMSTRILNEGEYPDLPAGTEVRTRIDPRTGAITDVIGPNSRPVVADVAKSASRGAPHYEKDAEGYLISVQDGVAKRVPDANGNPVRVKATSDDGAVQEIEINGRTLSVTDAQALNYFAQVGAQETKRTEAENEARTKRTAKLNESSSYYKKADNLMAEAKKLHGQPDPYGDVARKISEYENEARGLYVKGDAARAEAEAIPEPPKRYSGRTMSRASLERYAKDNGLSIEEAQKKVELEGVRVQ